MAYLVMEHINPGPGRPRKIAGALQWLRRIPVPFCVTIGSVGGCGASYRLFEGFSAPLAFSGIEALENYMNRVSMLCHAFLIIHNLSIMG